METVNVLVGTELKQFKVPDIIGHKAYIARLIRNDFLKKSLEEIEQLKASGSMSRKAIEELDTFIRLIIHTIDSVFWIEGRKYLMNKPLAVVRDAFYDAKCKWFDFNVLHFDFFVCGMKYVKPEK